MDFSIGVSANGLLVSVSGAPSGHEVSNMLAEVLKRSKESGIGGALIEARVEFALDTVATLSAVQELERLGFPPSFKFAVLVLGDVGRDSAQFAETAAYNRGRRVRAFDDRTAALAWLGSP